MSTTGDVHVGDIGTLYKAEIQDAGAAFDPSLATTKKLIFKTPNGVLERDATVTTSGSGATQKWYLEYRLTAGTDSTFHEKAGKKYEWQGYIEFANGDRYHTNIETYAVEKNLN